MVKKSESMEELFLHQKPGKLLLTIKNSNKRSYASMLAKEIDCTYSHCVRILKEMEELGLIQFEKKGRIKLVGLTKLGEDIAVQVDSLMRSFNRVDQ